MLRVLVPVLAALSMTVVPSTAWAAWSQPSGGPLDVVPAANASNPSIANVAGVPYVAWTELSQGHDQIFVKRLEGTSWVQVGDSLNVDPTRNANDPDITSVQGVPYVAWLETNGSHDELYVKRLLFGGWVAAGVGALNLEVNGDAANPSIVSVAGVPYVAWDEEQTGGHSLVFVARLDPGGWVAIGAGALNENLNDDAQSPKLADVGGLPWVVWSESDGTHVLVHVRRFDGTRFVPVGHDPLNLSTSQDAVLPSIAVIGGAPYVAWSEFVSVIRQIHVKRFVGSDWTTVGGSLNVDPTEDASAPTIASVGGAPAVVWQEDSGSVFQIRFSRFDGAAWRPFGGPLNVDPSQNAMFVDPTLVDIGGVPYVTWQEANGMMVDVRVKRLEPDILAESATPAASDASLTAEINDFGVPLPVGFDYGAGAFSSQTPLQVSSGAGISTITEAIGGLQPATSYIFRGFGSDTFRETSVGVTEAFTTPPIPAGIASPPLASLPAPARISDLALIPSTFTAARRGASIAARRAGTLVSYVDSQAARTTFTVQRPTAGRLAGGRCVAASRRNRAHARCTRYLNVASFAHHDAAGANRFRFTGRVDGRTLAPGHYRLQAIPHNRGGTGRPAYRNFEVTA